MALFPNRKRNRQRIRRSRRLQSQPRMEMLEKRALLAAVLVDTDSSAIDAPDVSSILALQSNPGGDGISLSEAILAANNDPGADLIEFENSLLGSTITMSATRMTISDDLTIDGDIDNDGVADITIDGAQSTAVTRQHFDITGGTTTLYGLNMTRSRARVPADGTGGIDVRAGATLNLYNSRLTDGFSYRGVAGIDNAGTTNIRNSQINGNFCYADTSAQGIAGIRNQAGGGLRLINSSMTGNAVEWSSLGFAA